MRSPQAIRCWLLVAGVASSLTAAAVTRGQETAVQLSAPAGFEVQVFAAGLDLPRGLAFGPDGRLYVSETGAGRIVRLNDVDADGRADSLTVLIDGLDRPSGLVWLGPDLLVAEPSRVLRLTDPATYGAGVEAVVVLEDLPADSAGTRALLPDLSGWAFFVSVAASCRLCAEPDERRAAVLRVSHAGIEVWARGLADVAGLARHPDTGELWATCRGWNGLGDRLPPDELNVVRRGAHYGWPYCYGARVPHPAYADRARCDPTEPPVMTFAAHSLPLGIAFYAAGTFPVEYRGDAFVALQGSSVRGLATGYKVVRLDFEAGRPLELADFLTGWVGAGGEVRGRPVQPLVGPDGALYVSDDVGGRIWRVGHVGGSL